MARYVAVRYLLPVYATVDLDGDEGVVEVQEGDSDIVRLDDHAGVAWLTEGDLIAESYYGDEPVDPGSLTADERDRVLEIAEAVVWPAWERY